jgi:superfamily I DNA and/or RNA helicase
MRHSLQVAIDVMRDGSLSDISPAAALAAWQCLFMVVPVISTTFASVARLFRHLEQEALGFLLIDEAGQSTPQNAAGAIWRSRYTVVVGDPLQLEPVVTLPLGAQRDLQVAHGVPDSLLPNHCSVQSLADGVTPVGTVRANGDLWVGSPLNVHRRCEEPMFEIVNQIAYDGQMINHTPPREAMALPGSAWLHVAGQRSEGHWIPEEGERLEQLLAELAGCGADFAEVFLIAPFRDVAMRLGRYRRPYPGITAGTIHTTQGKEADVVILVLGGDPMRTGDKAWAAQRPNLLNVAISRARRRLYVVGNRETWGGLAHFQMLARTLEMVDETGAVRP